MYMCINTKGVYRQSVRKCKAMLYNIQFESSWQIPLSNSYCWLQWYYSHFEKLRRKITFFLFKYLRVDGKLLVKIKIWQSNDIKSEAFAAGANYNRILCWVLNTIGFGINSDGGTTNTNIMCKRNKIWCYQ